VDGSSVGHELHKRYGFEDVDEMKIDLEGYDQEAGFGIRRWIAMTRQPKTM